MKRKEIEEIENYKCYYVNLKTIMKNKHVSKNSLCRRTGIAYNSLQRYYRNEIQRVDLDVISKMCSALGCEINDILIR